MRYLILALALTLSPAASHAGDAKTPVDTGPDACNAAQHQDLVGQDEAAVAEAGITPGVKARVFGPGTMLTRDYFADRINVELDENGTVVRIYCG